MVPWRAASSLTTRVGRLTTASHLLLSSMSLDPSLTELVPSLLGMYDQLVSGGTRHQQPDSMCQKLEADNELRPVSMVSSSTDASSTRMSSGTCPDDNNDEMSDEEDGNVQSSEWEHGRPCLAYPHRVVQEIIDTETTYVSDLEHVINGYVCVLQLSGSVHEQQLTEMFGNIQEIYVFNKQLLLELKECELDPVRVAQCFVRHNSGFTIYTQYCTNYPRSVAALTKLLRSEEGSRMLRERQAALHHTLPLGSYLLKPVQRILKYHLLLQNLTKQCNEELEGYNHLVTALSTMTGIAHHINEMKRRHEHAVRVHEIQGLLDGWQGEDLGMVGELVMEGQFRVAGAKSIRHVFLFEHLLLITKKKEDASLLYKAHIECCNLMLIESVPGDSLSFHVLPFDNPRMQYTLQARTLEQKRAWTLQLKRVILENYEADIPSHARQLVLDIGQNYSPDSSADKSILRRQYSVPQYLERRRKMSDQQTTHRQRLRRMRPRSTLLKKASTEDVEQDAVEADVDEDDGDRKASSVSCPTDMTPDEEEALQRRVPELPRHPSESLEEIVSQLLMQNVRFRRVLNHRYNRRHVACIPAEETTDTEGEEEAIGVSHLYLRQRSEEIPRHMDNDFMNFFGMHSDKQEEKESTRRSESRRGSETLRRSASLSQSDVRAEKLKRSDSLTHSDIENKSGSCFSFGKQPRSVNWYEPSESAKHVYIKKASGTPVLKKYLSDAEDTDADIGPSPSKSMETITFYPEHKVYKAGLSRTRLRRVLNRMSSKLVGLKGSISQSTLENQELSSAQNSDCDTDLDCSPIRDRSQSIYNSRNWESSLEGSPSRNGDKNNSSQLVSALARQYSRHLRKRIRQLIHDDRDPEVPYPFYRPGSSVIGARIARSTEVPDYACPKQVLKNLPASQRMMRGLTLDSSGKLRPESALSLASTFTSSSDGDKTSGMGASLDTSVSFTESTANLATLEEQSLSRSFQNCQMDSSSDSDTNISGDSFYERSFDKIEQTLDARDSAVFSDQEEAESPRVSPRTYRRLGGVRSDYSCKVRRHESRAKRELVQEYQKQKADAKLDSNPKLSSFTPKLTRKSKITLKSPQSSFKLFDKSEYKKKKPEDSWKETNRKKVPPPIPSKPASSTKKPYQNGDEAHRKYSLDESYLKGGISVAECGEVYFSREDLSETGSQHSVSTVNTVIENNDAAIESQPLSKGWVQHVINKLSKD